MSKRKRASKPISVVPKAPPLHEEPLRGIEPRKLTCQICGKTFNTHDQLARHMEHMHGNPEKTHTSPHSG